MNDNESFVYDLPSAGADDYYIRVFYGNGGNSYNLKWSSEALLQPDISVEYPSRTVLSSGGATIDFGDTLVGDSSSRTFVIRNVGQLTLTGISAAFSGTNSADFEVTSQGHVNLNGGSVTTLTVRYNATENGLASAMMAISSNDPDENPFLIPLAGTGVTPEITPSVVGIGPLISGSSVIDFGDVPVGSTLEKRIVITNDGTGQLTGVSSSLVGGDSGDFQRSIVPSTIPAGRKSYIDVTFAPSSYGALASSFYIYSNDADEGTFNVQLTGFGAVAAPNGLVVVRTGLNTVELRWDPVLGATSYTIYRSTDDSFANAEVAGNTTATDFEDGDLLSETEYYYWVESSDGSKTERVDSPVAGTTQFVRPDLTLGKNLSEQRTFLVLKTKQRRKAQAFATLTNQGSIRERLRFFGGSTNSKFKVSYFQLGDQFANITGTVTTQAYYTPYLSRPEFTQFNIQVKPRTKKRRATFVTALRAVSSTDPDSTDLSILKVKKIK